MQIVGKLVVLNLDGDWESQGFRATLSIAAEGDRPLIETRGKLPAAPELHAVLNQWQDEYRSLKRFSRIKTGKARRDVSPEKLLKRCRSSAGKLGDRLGNWLDSPEFVEIDRRLREELDRTESIRVLISTSDRQLQQLPWHLWNICDRYPRAEVAISPPKFERIENLLSQKCTTDPWERKSKVRILAILGDSEGIDVQADRQLLSELPDAEIQLMIEPRRQEINDELWAQPWDIIFFAGHGQTAGQTGRIYINQSESLTIDDLWYALKKAVARGLQLAIFNSCQGLGLTRKLDDLQIPQMIIMRELVPDRVAHDFLKYFLRAFAGGQPLYLAVRAAREQLQGLEDDFPCATWLPVIYQNQSVVPPTWSQLRAWPQPQNLVPTSAQLERSGNYWQQLVGGFNLLDITSSKKLRFAALLLLGVCSIGWNYSLPQLSKFVNNRGLASYLEGRFSRAENAFQLARMLNPQNRATLYNQAWHCEEVRDFQCAREKYQMSAKLGLPAAYSNLGRLYIKDSDYDGAVDLLQKGLKLASQDPVKYALHKNLGWARLGQGRYQEAEAQLYEAIALDGDRASAYCLLAQVKEKLGDTQVALNHWSTCQEYGRSDDTDEDAWLGMARQRLPQTINPARDGDF